MIDTKVYLRGCTLHVKEKYFFDQNFSMFVDLRVEKPSLKFTLQRYHSSSHYLCMFGIVGRFEKNLPHPISQYSQIIIYLDEKFPTNFNFDEMQLLPQSQ